MHNLGFIQPPQRPYSPDIAPNDFLLFGYRKGKLAGKTFICEDAVTAMLKEIPIKMFCDAMDAWKSR
jgi:hypothetical protein